MLKQLSGKRVLILDSSYSGSKFNFQKMALVAIFSFSRSIFSGTGFLNFL